ncbi:MAG TPA: C39 family peptidase, partial [Verrucomicrobiae bacterium]|nr:C39 family peptidase [Verrucomicrobiae bacterium]
QMPFDSTPHVDGQWGDPDEAFVGSVDGIMPIDGYGIHWRPVAAVARHWRKAEVLEGASPQVLAQHIQAGRPVIVWGHSGLGGTQLWHTPKGKTVHALKGEHTRVVCGLRGPPSAPEGFYLMDPNCGLVYWPVRLLMSNWEPSGRAGVVIFAEPPPNLP